MLHPFVNHCLYEPDAWPHSRFRDNQGVGMMRFGYNDEKRRFRIEAEWVRNWFVVEQALLKEQRRWLGGACRLELGDLDALEIRRLGVRRVSQNGRQQDRNLSNFALIFSCID